MSDTDLKHWHDRSAPLRRHRHCGQRWGPPSEPGRRAVVCWPPAMSDLGSEYCGTCSPQLNSTLFVMEDLDRREQNAEAGTLALGQRLVANAFRYRTAKPQDTHVFRQFRHDADLVPRVTQQLRFLMEGFHRDTNVTYDIQGLYDAGTDVLLRLQSVNDCRFIGVQIKSHKELGQKDLIVSLRDQLSRSEDRYSPLLRWYLFLGADISDQTDRRTFQRVRAIQSAFAKKPKVTIVDPVYAMTFLRLSKAQMDSLTTLTLRTGDPLVEDASADLRRHPVEAALLLRLVTNTVGREAAQTTFKELQSDPWLREIALRTPRDNEQYDPESDDDALVTSDLPNDVLRQMMTLEVSEVRDTMSNWIPQLADHMDRLSGELDRDRVGFFAPVYLHPALYALATEGRVKHDLEFDELVDYLIDTILGE